ncbi:zinc-dependent alcohol dehydrogenase family protein [candidate division KSB1 bacterium]|nr:zinc-dependent alcohol dehydrogenase family protein [candidate division KSB1 bacterium]
MKCIVLYAPHQLGVEERKIAQAGPDEVLVRVKACGVCGTDIHIFEGTAPANPPVVLGHEFVGVIEDVGSGVRSLKKGDRIAVDPNLSCGGCYYCRRGLGHLCQNLKALGVTMDGGFSEYCLVPQSQAYRLQPDLNLEWGCFLEPLSCAVHGIDLVNLQVGDSVVILGLGPIGLMMVQLARLKGATRIIVVEPVGGRRKLAERLGCDRVIDPGDGDPVSVVMENTVEGADVVLECSGTPQAAGLSLRLARRGGTVLFFGVCDIDATIPLKPQQIYFKELTVLGSYINPHTFSRALDLLEAGKVRVDSFSIEKFPLERVLDAFEFHRSGKVPKTLVIP